MRFAVAESTMAVMGFWADAKEQADQRAEARMGGGDCPTPGPHYLTEVNKGSINMKVWQNHLNTMYSQGYRLFIALEQSGNTVQVFEHRHP